MEKPYLIKDGDGHGVQALIPTTTVTNTITNGAAVRYTLPTDTNLVRIGATCNCYIKFGDSGVTATSADIVFPIGAEVLNMEARGWTHISILGIDSSPGYASITRMV